MKKKAKGMIAAGLAAGMIAGSNADAWAEAKDQVSGIEKEQRIEEITEATYQELVKLMEEIRQKGEVDISKLRKYASLKDGIVDMDTYGQIERQLRVLEPYIADYALEYDSMEAIMEVVNKLSKEQLSQAIKMYEDIIKGWWLDEVWKARLLFSVMLYMNWHITWAKDMIITDPNLDFNFKEDLTKTTNNNLLKVYVWQLKEKDRQMEIEVEKKDKEIDALLLALNRLEEEEQMLDNIIRELDKKSEELDKKSEKLDKVSNYIKELYDFIWWRIILTEKQISIRINFVEKVAKEVRWLKDMLDKWDRWEKIKKAVRIKIEYNRNMWWTMW